MKHVTKNLCDKVSSFNVNMINHKRSEVSIRKVRVNLQKLNRIYLEQLVNNDKECTDIIVNCDTAEDVTVHDPSTDSEYDENVDDVGSGVETNYNSAEETEDDSAEETEDDSAEESENDSAEETSDDERIEVDGKKGKLVARNLSLQEARDFFDNL